MRESVDYLQAAQSMHRVPGTPGAASGSQQERVGELEEKLSALEQLEEEDYETAGGEGGYRAAEALTCSATSWCYSDDERAIAGCIVALGAEGQIVVHAGLVRPEDVPWAAAGTGSDSSARRATTRRATTTDRCRRHRPLDASRRVGRSR